MANAEKDSGPYQTLRMVFNGINPVNNFAKFSASGV